MRSVCFKFDPLYLSGLLLQISDLVCDHCQLVASVGFNKLVSLRKNNDNNQFLIFVPGLYASVIWGGYKHTPSALVLPEPPDPWGPPLCWSGMSWPVPARWAPSFSQPEWLQQKEGYITVICLKLTNAAATMLHSLVFSLQLQDTHGTNI